MRFNKGAENRDKLAVNSRRACNFYIQYLSRKRTDASFEYSDGSERRKDNRRIEALNRINECEQIEECEANINEEIEYLIGKDNKLNGLISDLRKAFQATQLPSDKLTWFDKKNERLCNWVWSFLDQHTMQENDDTLSTDYAVEGDEYYYPGVYNGSFLDLRLSITPFSIPTSNVSERLTAIKEAFEYAEADVSGQQKIIKLIKLVWGDVYSSKCSSSFVDWLDESNEAQCKWTWEYFRDLKSREHKSFFYTWRPHNDKEKISAMIAAVDMGVLKNLDRTELFISKMKRAWSQQKFRENTKATGKKVYSYSMTLETKKMLDEIALRDGLKLNEVLEQLIKEKHKNT